MMWHMVIQYSSESNTVLQSVLLCDVWSAKRTHDNVMTSANNLKNMESGHAHLFDDLDLTLKKRTKSPFQKIMEQMQRVLHIAFQLWWLHHGI